MMENNSEKMSARLKARNHIINIIYQHPGEQVKIPSYNELGPKLGVAKSSVQLALKQLISEGYLISRVGIGTFTNPKHGLYLNSNKKRFAIGVINGDGNIFYQSYYGALMNSAISKALALRCIDIQPIMLGVYNSESIKEEIISRGLDALLWCMPPRKRSGMLQELATEMPLLLVEESIEKIHCIVFNRGENGRMIGKRLLADGRKKVAVSPCFSENVQKRQCLSQTFAEAGYPVDPDFIFLDKATFPDRLEELLQQNKIPDSLVFNPEETETVHGLLKKYNIRLPEQCQGVCSIFRLHGCDMPMYVQQIDFDDFAEKAVDRLLVIVAQRDLVPETLIIENTTIHEL